MPEKDVNSYVSKMNFKDARKRIESIINKTRLIILSILFLAS